MTSFILIFRFVIFFSIFRFSDVLRLVLKFEETGIERYRETASDIQTNMYIIFVPMHHKIMISSFQ